jgi:CheY-like chemotaxis protein
MVWTGLRRFLPLCNDGLYCVRPRRVVTEPPGCSTQIHVGHETDGAFRRCGGKHGDRMTTNEKTAASKRVLVVEDELMIRMLLEGMLTDLGHTVAAEAGSIDEALTLAKEAAFDIAILDVNLNGKPINPVVEVLVERGVPFVFASGYGQSGVPQAYRSSPVLQKPFQSEALGEAIKAAALKPVG